mgnify:CR=1 FL=1
MKRKRFSRGSSGGNSGISLVELIISMMIFTIVILSSILVFRESIFRFGKERGEKKVLSETAAVFTYIEKYITAAMCNDKQGPGRINFAGESDMVRFVSPFYKGKESDLARFAFYHREVCIRASVTRVDADNPDFSFPENFSGSQVLGENVSLFLLEYHDGKEWKTGWNTAEMESPSLPEAVRISLTTHSEKIEGKKIEKKFTRIINIGW